MLQKNVLRTAFLLSLLPAASYAAEELVIDGKLDESAWKSAEVRSDFTCPASSGKKSPAAGTEFRILAGPRKLTVGIRCAEPEPGKIRTSPSSIWTSDGVELFLSPSCDPSEYYHFFVSAANDRYSMYLAEAGMIRPDPYAPFWKSAVFRGDDFWSAEIEIPYSAFYMTRNVRWKTEWLLNVARTRTPVREASSWSPIRDSFHETNAFRKVSGFPVRDSAEDLFLKSVTADIASVSGGLHRGTATVTAEAVPASAGVYTLECRDPSGTLSSARVELKSGENVLSLPEFSVKKTTDGKIPLELLLKSGKTSLGRYYPTEIEYRPMKFLLTTPGYRQTFYPGQESGTVKGILQLRLSPEQKKTSVVRISISGDGVPEKALEFTPDSNGLPFEFETRDLGEKAVLEAVLVSSGNVLASTRTEIRKPRPAETTMIWIENGHLVKDGKPFYPRGIYARYWMTGSLFRERMEADTDLAETRDWVSVDISPDRLVPGIEGHEATKDIRPSPALFEALRKRIEENRGRNFTSYYIEDEPECRNISPVYLRYIYEYVKTLDPFHPCVMCSREAERFLDCADVFSVHPYLSPRVYDGKRTLGVPVIRCRDRVRDVTNAGRPDKAVGFTGQFFSYKFNDINSDYPSREELEAMSWSAIANGSVFHFPYACHDLGDRPQLYECYRYINQSIGALEGYLLSGKPVPGKSSDPDADFLIREWNGGILLIAVNPCDSPLAFTLESSAFASVPVWHEFRGDGVRKGTPDGKMKFELPAYGCAVLMSEKDVSGLEPHASVVKKVEELNRARKERGNLLFEKGGSFEVDSSNPVTGMFGALGQKNKLFDGTLDMLGWQSKNTPGPHWYEIDFPKRPPVFSKVAVHGRNLKSASLRLWKAGEWKTPEVLSVRELENGILLELTAPLKSVKVRLDLERAGSGPIELYEIELLK